MIRVLHVDDSEMDRELVKAKLLRITKEIEILQAESGQEALKILESQTVECILSDFQMPVMDGMSFLKSLKSNGINLPFVFLTGQGNEMIAADALRSGADDYYTKTEGIAHYERLFHRLQLLVESRKQVKIQQENEEKAKRFGQILEDSINEVYIFDATDLHFIQVNRVARNHLQYTSEELQELTPFDIKPEFTGKEFKEFIRPLQEGKAKKIRFDSVHKRKDGTLYPVEVNLQHLAYGSTPVFFATILDKTDRKQIEEALRFTRVSIDQSKTPAFWLDKDARLTYVNNAACQSLGYTKDEMMGLDLHDLDPYYPRENWGEHWETFKNYKSRTIETYHKRKDGSIFPVEVDVNHVEYDGNEYHCTFARDISRWKLLEAVCKESLTTLLEILQNLDPLSSDLENSRMNLEIFMGTCFQEPQKYIDETSRKQIQNVLNVKTHVIDQLQQMLKESAGRD